MIDLRDFLETRSRWKTAGRVPEKGRMGGWESRGERKGKGKVEGPGSCTGNSRISYNVGDRGPGFKPPVSTVGCLPLNKPHTLTEPQS